MVLKNFTKDALPSSHLLAEYKSTCASRMLAVLFGASVVLSAQVSADDTEVYFAQKLSDADSAANVLFMFDTSGSMLDGTGTSRLTRLKEAMTSVVNTSSNVNIGIGSFNGVIKGGSIRLAATNVDKDMCPGATCNSLEIRGEINSDADDGVEQSSDGTVDLYSDNIDMDKSQVQTGSYSCGWGSTCYTYDDYPNITALRFTNLNIPRGATINHATLQFLAYSQQTSSSSLTIVAENSANSPALTEDDENISDRLSDVTSSVTWNPDDWYNGYMQYEQLSPELNTIIETVTDGTGWCGGNALTLLISSTGSRRRAMSHDNDPYRAPVLHIDYDPSSVDWNDTCLRSSSTSTVSHGTDDVIQDLTSGVIEADANRVRTHKGVGTDRRQIIGLRFKKAAIPAGANIIQAYLELPINGAVAGNVDLSITAEDTHYSGLIESDVASSLTVDRTFLSPAINWSNVPESASGASTMVRSPDISSLITTISAKDNWNGEGAITFKLTPSASSTGERFFDALESPSGAGARLVVDYQVDGTGLGGVAPVLWTGREEMIRTMLNLEAYGGTPLTDSYYEASQYMRGGDVVYGKQRGSQRSQASNYPDYPHQLSSPETYESGPGIGVTNPPGCTGPNRSSPACVLEIVTGSPKYKNPPFGQCQSNQIVVLSDGIANYNNSKARIKARIGGNCASRSEDGEICAIELAKWMYENDQSADTPGFQKLITHTIGVDIATGVLMDMAEQSGGTFNEVSSASELTSVFRNIIQSAILETSSFVAPSSSANLSNRLVNSNNLYFAMFKPSKTTVWDGNLKRYKLGVNSSTGDIEIRDADDVLATATDGSMLSTAKSFWSAEADGNEVRDGGAASNVSLTNRKVWTSMYDATADDVILKAFSEDEAAIDHEVLGIQGLNNAYRTQLIKWARGVDVKDFDNDDSFVDARTQMGDPMHSTPFIMNYQGEELTAAVEASEAVEATDTTDAVAAVEAADATYKAPNSLIFIGTNHGFLHAINAADGTEKFAYIPEELLDNLDYFYRDEAADHDARPYGLDGEVSGWHDDKNNDGLINGEDKAYIYVGMRRGGRNYYALDVTDPDAPQFAWKIEGGKTDGFLELGQSWSKPIKATVNHMETEKDVLFFAGGYDDINDDEAGRAADLRGRAIYMVNAATGALESHRDTDDHEEMIYSIPSELRVINTTGDEYADAIFVGDTGGQLWRFDINNTAVDDEGFMTGAVMAQISGDEIKQNRKFFYEPDVALIKGSDGGMFLNIAIGSGARSNPNSSGAEDGFYSFRDANIYGPPRNSDGDIEYPEALTEVNLTDISENFSEEEEESETEDDSGDTDSAEGGDDETVVSVAESETPKRGWFFRFQTAREKSLSPALTVDNQVMFTSYVPPGTGGDVCAAVLGTGRLYSLDVLNGDPANNGDDSEGYVELAAQGIPPRVAGMIVDAAPDEVSIIVGTETIGTGTGAKVFERTFWAEQ